MTPFRITPRSFALVAAIVAVGLAGMSGRAAAAPLTLVGTSQKICQLTGDNDWTTGLPTAARTHLNYQLVGVDLGFPVDSGPGGPLYFLFGDASPSSTGNPLTPDDAIGYTNRTAPPDSETCLDLKLVPQAGAFAHPTVTPEILQGSFNVPTGGVFFDNQLWAFFWTDHCLAVPLVPMPKTPLQLPKSSGSCPESPQFNILGNSVLAFADRSMPATFTQVPALPPGPGSGPITQLHRDFSMPSGFVYVTAAPPEPQVHVPPRPGVGPTTYVPVFGVARYRLSIPYLAMAPQETFFDPATWLFFAGWLPHDEPKFITRAEWESGHDPITGQWTPPTGAELYTDTPAGSILDHCVGEHSVTYNAALRTWLLLYACREQVQARTAPAPWGPWSPPTKLISDTDTGVRCTLLMREGGCGVEQPSSWPAPYPAGFFYAPFALERFTQDVTPKGAVGTRTAKIYWLVSTWNPYQVIVMQSTLRFTPN